MPIPPELKRRDFLKTAAVGSVALPLVTSATGAAAKLKPVRIGVIGMGGRGTSLMRTCLSIPGVTIPAVCDIVPDKVKQAQELVVEAGLPTPEGYTAGETDYQRLVERDDLDAVIIATPWEWHTPMAVDTMKAGKDPGVEVPCSLTVDECWDLVNTSEETGIPCMMLENWSFRSDNLAVLNMIRAGLFGESVHCHCAHSHDCLGHWFYGKKWPFKYLEDYNCDLYPTHQLGPVLSWMDINCGDAFDYITSTATAAFGPPDYFARTKGADHALAQKDRYKQGDIVTSVIKTKKGKTIVSNYDMQLPRPYDNRWMIQGERGLYSEMRDSVYIDDNPQKKEQWEPFKPYHEKYQHAWADVSGGGHGGADGRMLTQFVAAVRHQTQTPLDVYDSVTMSVIFDVSGQSIAQGSMPVKVPDFTRGRWKTRKPYFGMTA
jgi:predicted dehydrogenase